MSSIMKMAFEQTADPAIAQLHDKDRKPDQDPAAQPNPQEGNDPAISQVTKDGADPALTTNIENKDDPTIDNNTEVEGVDVIGSVAKALATEAIVVTMEQELDNALDASDRVDGLIELHEVVTGMNEPTPTEKRLIQIADSLTQGYTESEATPLVTSQESFNDLAQTIANKIIGTTKSVSDSISGFYSAFGNFLGRVTANFRTYRGHINKLRSMVRKLAINASKQEVTLNVKNDKFLYTGDDTGSEIRPVQDSKELHAKMSELCNNYRQFCTALSGSILDHQRRYIEAFTAIFNSTSGEDTFFNELRAFDNGFLNQLRTKSELNISTKTAELVIHRSKVGLGGMFFSVVTPNDSVYDSRSTDTVLKTFDHFHFGPEVVSFKADTKDRQLVTSVADLDAMVTDVEKAITGFESLNNEAVTKAVDELAEFSVQTGSASGANTGMKFANMLNRLPVLEARVVIEGYLRSYYGLNEIIEFLNRFCYNTVSAKPWFEQDIGLS